MGIYHTKKSQNKRALVSTKHCQVWQIMAITEHFYGEFGVFRLILCRIQVNITTKASELADWGGVVLHLHVPKYVRFLIYQLKSFNSKIRIDPSSTRIRHSINLKKT